MHKAIVNTNIVTPNGIIYDGKLVVENNRIFDILEAGDPIPADTEIIDAMGGYEARSSCYKSGVAEAIVEGGWQIIAELADLGKERTYA